MEVPKSKRMRPRGPSLGGPARPRSYSLAGRMRSASELADNGAISAEAKNVIVDALLADDAEVKAAMAAFEQTGQVDHLQQLITSGYLSARRDAFEGMGQDMGGGRGSGAPSGSSSQVSSQHTGGTGTGTGAGRGKGVTRVAATGTGAPSVPSPSASTGTASTTEQPLQPMNSILAQSLLAGLSETLKGGAGGAGGAAVAGGAARPPHAAPAAAADSDEEEELAAAAAAPAPAASAAEAGRSGSAHGVGSTLRGGGGTGTGGAHSPAFVTGLQSSPDWGSLAGTRMSPLSFKGRANSMTSPAGIRGLSPLYSGMSGLGGIHGHLHPPPNFNLGAPATGSASGGSHTGAKAGSKRPRGASSTFNIPGSFDLGAHLNEMHGSFDMSSFLQPMADVQRAVHGVHGHGHGHGHGHESAGTSGRARGPAASFDLGPSAMHVSASAPAPTVGGGGALLGPPGGPGVGGGGVGGSRSRVLSDFDMDMPLPVRAASAAGRAASSGSAAEMASGVGGSGITTLTPRFVPMYGGVVPPVGEHEGAEGDEEGEEEEGEGGLLGRPAAGLRPSLGERTRATAPSLGKGLQMPEGGMSLLGSNQRQSMRIARRGGSGGGGGGLYQRDIWQTEEEQEASGSGTYGDSSRSARYKAALDAEIDEEDAAEAEEEDEEGTAAAAAEAGGKHGGMVDARARAAMRKVGGGAGYGADAGRGGRKAGAGLRKRDGAGGAASGPPGLPSNFDPTEVVLPTGFEVERRGDIDIPITPKLANWVGAYSLEARMRRIARFHSRRQHRVWEKTVKYDVRKSFADSRLRVKGRFVKKEDETLLRDFMQLL